MAEPGSERLVCRGLRPPVPVPVLDPGPLRRQRHDAAGLQLLQHPQTGPQPIPTLRREPAQMSAQGGGQLMAAQRRKHFHRLLEVRNLTAGQPRATEGGRLQLLDSGIHHVGTRDHLTRKSHQELSWDLDLSDNIIGFNNLYKTDKEVP